MLEGELINKGNDLINHDYVMKPASNHKGQGLESFWCTWKELRNSVSLPYLSLPFSCTWDKHFLWWISNFMNKWPPWVLSTHWQINQEGYPGLWFLKPKEYDHLFQRDAKKKSSGCLANSFPLLLQSMYLFLLILFIWSYLSEFKATKQDKATVWLVPVHMLGVPWNPAGLLSPGKSRFTG